MAPKTASTPKIIVFDSGLGGLTVYRELRDTLPNARYLYIADTDAFPYGNLHKGELLTRLLALFDRLIEREKPDICVIACNTASTIALAHLRDHFEVPFIGTVPAIKVAAQQTRTGLFSVLGTPSTVAQDYTLDLVERYAGSCEVTMVGASDLAMLAEQFMQGEKVDEDLLRHEIAPAFARRNGQRTDCIALGCTHYPLLVDLMHKVAPWSVTYIDPAAAIARQTQRVLSQHSVRKHAATESGANQLLYTGGDGIGENISPFLQAMGLLDVSHDEIIG
ncbi:MAG: glutamate racemase [bacterium]|nr:glutamate racemase [bacterium]